MRFKFIIYLFLVPCFGFSQLNFLPVNADYATFKMNDSLSYVEFYVSFFQNNLQYNNVNDTMKASFSTTLKILYEDSLFYQQAHNYVNSELDTMSTRTYDSFLDIYKIALPFRKFAVTVTLKDNNANSSGEYLVNLNIPGPSEYFSLSDIQLASSIKRAEGESKFYKNGLEVIPHPRRTFDILNPMLYYYIELNNLSANKDAETTYEFEYFVTDQNSDTVKTGKVKTANIVAITQAEIGSFNALSLPKGMYYLNIRAVDNHTNKSSNIRKKFYVNKPTQQTETVAEIQSDTDPLFIAMNAEELEHELDITEYIRDRHEDDVAGKLDSLAAIRKFLTAFWGRRDKAAARPHGESHRIYAERVMQANEMFSRGSKEGWDTDRGRVLITYGPPDDIERHPYSDNSKPYSIWKYYQLDGGSDFIFFDRMGFGQYELIHSTYYKELQNPNWRNEIFEGNTPGF